MPNATSTYSLIVESQSRGEAALRQLEQVLDSVTRRTQRAQVEVSQSFKASMSGFDGFEGKLRESIENPFRTAGSAIKGFLGSLGPVGAAAGTIAGSLAAVGTAAFALTASVGDAAEHIINLSDQTGLTVDSLDRLQAMGKIAGVGIDGIVGSARRLSTVLSESSAESIRLRGNISELGVELYDSIGQQRDTGEVLEQLLQKLSSAKSQTELLATAQKTLGRGAGELLPLIKNYQDLDRTVRNLGFGERSDLLRSIATTADKLDELGLKWDLLKGKLAVPAAGVVEIVTKFISSFGEPIKINNGNGTATSSFVPVGGFGALAGPNLNVGPPLTLSQPRPAFSLEATLQTQARFEQLQAEREAAAARFNRSFGGTEPGLKSRLADLQEQRSSLIGPLSAPTLDTAKRTELEQKFVALGGEIKATEAAIKRLGESGQRASELARALAGLRSTSEIDKALDQLQGTFEKLFTLGATSKQITAARPFILRESFEATAKAGKFDERSRALIDNRNAADVNAALNALNSPDRGLPVFVSTERDRGASSSEAAKRQQDAALLEGLKASEERRNQRLAQSQNDLLAIEERRIQLLAGPAGEVNALERITALRLRNVEIQKQLGQQIDEAGEKQRILADRELQLLEIRRRQVDSIKEATGRGFDAAVSGGASGIGALVRSQGLGVLRTFAQNASGEIAGGISGRLSLPGQRNQDGTPTLVGRLLANTPFADDGLKRATSTNTIATIENTATMRQLGVLLAGGGAGGPAAGAGTFSTIRALGGSGSASGGGILTLPEGVFSGSQANPFIFSATGGVPGVVTASGPGSRGATVTLPEGVFRGNAQNPALANLGSSGTTFANQYGSTATTAAVYGAAIAGGAFGVYSGIKQGGAKGALTASAAALGTAAALDPEPVSKAVLTIAAVAAGLLTQVFPDPKKARDARINRMLDSARYRFAESESSEVGFDGQPVDYGAGGAPRVVIQVNAMDARSFIDRRDDIVAAIGSAYRASNPELGQIIKEAASLG